MCGNNDPCTAESWLSYMGNTDNVQVPFTILYTITDKAEIPSVSGKHIFQPMNYTIEGLINISMLLY